MDRFRNMTRSIFLWAIATNILSAADTTLLDRAGARVERFWDEMSSVSCSENVLREKFNEKEKLLLKNQSVYDYLISMRWNAGELLVDESRVEANAPRKLANEGSLLATRGFATLLLILHPEFQSSFHFETRAEESIDGRKLIPIDFLPKTGGRSPAALELKGREYPIAWEGTAWIDSATGMAARIDAHWKEPAEELGLTLLSTSVKYGPVLLRTRPYWLPQTAQVELRTKHQHWRNTHQFERYKLFNVEADDKIESKPEAK